MMLQLIIFLMVSDFPSASSNPIMTTSGKSFVVASPPTSSDDPNYECKIYFTTEYTFDIIVSVVEPKDIKAKLPSKHDKTKSTYTITRDNPGSYTMNSTSRIPNHMYGLYWSTIITANKPIKVLVFSRNPTNTQSDAYVAMPEKTCYKSYYVTTTIGFPVIMVFTFLEKTQIGVEFPSFRKPFHIVCTPSGLKCVPNQTTNIEMESYQVWFLHWPHADGQFQNTHITSNRPIFVVSGGTRCRSEVGEHSICYSSMKPTVTWGKEYLVPNLQDSNGSKTLHLRFNAKRWPLYIDRYHQSVKPIMKTEKVIDYQSFLVYREIEESMLFTCNETFGLYLFLQYQNGHVIDITMHTCIPTEQWMSTWKYVNNGLEKYYGDFSFLVTIRTPIGENQPFRDSRLIWYRLYNVNGWKYNTFSLPKDLMGSLISKEELLLQYPSLLYLRGSVGGKGIGIFSYPYDYHRAYIKVDGKLSVPTSYENSTAIDRDSHDDFVEKLPGSSKGDKGGDGGVNSKDQSTANVEGGISDREDEVSIAVFVIVVVLSIVLIVLCGLSLGLWYKKIYKRT